LGVQLTAPVKDEDADKAVLGATPIAGAGKYRPRSMGPVIVFLPTAKARVIVPAL
jgi:hypothetical protein